MISKTVSSVLIKKKEIKVTYFQQSHTRVRNRLLLEFQLKVYKCFEMSKKKKNRIRLKNGFKI